MFEAILEKHLQLTQLYATSRFVNLRLIKGFSLTLQLSLTFCIMRKCMFWNLSVLPSRPAGKSIKTERLPPIRLLNHPRNQFGNEGRGRKRKSIMTSGRNQTWTFSLFCINVYFFFIFLPRKTQKKQKNKKLKQNQKKNIWTFGGNQSVDLMFILIKAVMLHWRHTAFGGLWLPFIKVG